MRHFLSVAALAMLVSTGAEAGLVKVSFTGTNSSPVAPNVFGTAVPTITGYVIYDDETAGTPFVVNASRSAYNYAGAIKEIGFDLGSGIGGTASGDLGSMQVSDQFTVGQDRLSFNNIFLTPAQTTGEPAGTVRFQVTIGMSGPFSALSTSDLPGVFDPAIFTGQKNFSLFVNRGTGAPPAGAVSFNFNFDSVTVEPYGTDVPEPATLALFGLGAAAVGLRRRKSA
ncbi:PEP-CTERM sorting domain-containing protein [Sphingosinicella sp.]|uniref:PEP-CTERM sorting domain-containing protein n=1 Tax=Sphingosinicella sp. TaxID=1917971 RepID=UPI00181CC51B|nr:PEP-CTERM sorting domain-containing protein [Sphingosinicella sp.]MBA4757428.1 PEP-CTERM sorting domain-containing protein [Sphingosinicella sp.]